MIQDMFFEDWASLRRIVIVGVSFYAVLVLMLRLSGKRTLSRMDTFDMVISMAIGSILGRTLVSKDVALAESVVAAGLLIVLQVAVSMLNVHSKRFRQLLIARPALLYADGLFLEPALRRERVCREEILGTVHEKGLTDMAMVDAVILGSNGQLAVLVRPDLMRAARAPSFSREPESK